MPKLYLLRHGEAVAQWPDHSRPLTPRGCEQVARQLSRLPSELLVWHSPLLRAQQSLQQLQQQGFRAQPCLEISALEPEQSLLDLLQRLWPVTQDLLLVGHNPLLSALLTSLCGQALSLQTGQLAVLHGECFAPDCLQLEACH